MATRKTAGLAGARAARDEEPPTGMSAADPNSELWYTRHQQSLDPELKARDARLRHSVSRDVAAACVEARISADWRVDTGKTIARHRIDVRPFFYRSPRPASLFPLPCCVCPAFQSLARRALTQQICLVWPYCRILQVRGCQQSRSGQRRALARLRYSFNDLTLSQHDALSSSRRRQIGSVRRSEGGVSRRTPRRLRSASTVGVHAAPPRGRLHGFEQRVYGECKPTWKNRQLFTRGPRGFREARGLYENLDAGRLRNCLRQVQVSVSQNRRSKMLQRANEAPTEFLSCSNVYAYATAHFLVHGVAVVMPGTAHQGVPRGDQPRGLAEPVLPAINLHLATVL